MRTPKFATFACLSILACGDDAKPPTSPVTKAEPAATAPSTVPTGAPRAKIYPPAAKVPAVTEYWGTKVSDDYAWLEDSKNPEVAKFSEAQNALTRKVLDGSPDRSKIRARIMELVGAPSAHVQDASVRGGSYFLLRDDPPKQQPFLVVRNGVAGADRVVIDPVAYDASGKTTIDMFVPSPDGKLVAVSLSSGGSESGDVHVFDAATGKERKEDTIPRAYGGTAGGSLAWDEAGKGFFYTRYPRTGERPPADVDFYQQVYFHKLGTPSEKDVYEIGKDFPRIAEVVLTRSADGKTVLAEVQNGDGGDFMHLVRHQGKWKQLSKFEDNWKQATFGPQDNLFVVSKAESPRGKVLVVRKPYDANTALSGRLAEVEGAISEIIGNEAGVYGLVQTGGPSELVQLAVPTSLDASTVRFFRKLSPAGVFSISGIVPERSGDVIYRIQGYTRASEWRRIRKDGKDEALPWGKSSNVDLSDADVSREICISKDGTKVPVNILHKKGVSLDGERPTILTGYGGYGLSRAPRFRSLARIWLDQGGILADTNLRGGSEFGEEWHKQGNLTRKQNVFDDFAACADLLISRKYTKPARLAIMGGSNGGLLMGAAFTQHPEKYRAVVSMVGIYDMLRVETTPNGQFNIPEFGTVKNQDHFRALHAYSPLHNVKDGVAYPAILFTTGENDPRVDPFHSRKMVARMQDATSSDRPILLRTSKDTGHGMGTPLAAEIEESTDIYTFLYRELGLTQN